MERLAVGGDARRAWLTWPLVLAALLLLASCRSATPATASAPTIGRPLAQDPEVLKPFLWFDPGTDQGDAAFQAHLDSGDPLRVTTVLLLDWVASRDPQRTATRVDRVVERWRLDRGGGLDYPPFGALPAGWWSAMDRWAFPLLLVDLSTTSGDLRYLQLALSLVRQASLSVDAGGTVWRQADGCWFSEYAWNGMGPGDEYFVLNGHLYALQAVRMLGLALANAELLELYACGVLATKRLSGQFRMGDSWARYMLHPPTVDPTHYVIFETIQLDALARIDPDPFWTQEAQARRDLLRRFFPVSIRPDAAGPRLLVTALGGPHPYEVDTYPLRITCDDGGAPITWELSHPGDSRLSILERTFVDDSFALEPALARCRVESEYAGLRQTLHEGAVGRASVGSYGEELAFTLSALLDAVLQPDGTILVDPALRVSPSGAPETYLDTQGRIQLELAASSPWAPDQLLGVELDAGGELALGVEVLSGGRSYFRYYPRIGPGVRSLLLLSPVGFDGGEQLTSVERVTLFVYTDLQPAPVVVRPGRLLRFRDKGEIFEYVRDFDPNLRLE